MNLVRKRLLKHAADKYEPLQYNLKHQFAAKHTLNIYNSQALYTFIPKNACSTMRLSLAMANNCIEDIKDFNWIHKNNGTFRASLSELNTAKYTFVILRSPLHRLASVYLDKIVDRTNVAWTLYDLILRQTPLEEITFRKFVDMITDKALIHEEIHWRPQSDFLVYETYDDYFTLEAFSKAIPLIEKRTKIKIQDARPLTMHGTDQYELMDNKCYADVSPVEIFNMKQNGQLPSHESLYDKMIEETVKEAYKEDMDLYRSVTL